MNKQENSLYLDSLLLQELQQNDEKALGYLFSTYYNKLYRTGLRICHDHYLTEECIQDVFQDLWKYRQSLAKILSFEAYLVASVKKRIQRKLSKTVLGNQVDLEPTILSVESYEEILMIQEGNADRKKVLMKALDTISAKQKELIMLKYFEELSYKEMADKTGMPVDNIYKILHEGIKNLRSILSPST